MNSPAGNLRTKFTVAISVASEQKANLRVLVHFPVVSVKKLQLHLLKYLEIKVESDGRSPLLHEILEPRQRQWVTQGLWKCGLFAMATLSSSSLSEVEDILWKSM